MIALRQPVLPFFHIPNFNTPDFARAEGPFRSEREGNSDRLPSEYGAAGGKDSFVCRMCTLLCVGCRGRRHDVFAQISERIEGNCNNFNPTYNSLQVATQSRSQPPLVVRVTSVTSFLCSWEVALLRHVRQPLEHLAPNHISISTGVLLDS